MYSHKLQAEMDDLRTVWCGNLAEEVSEQILYELFLQVAPLDRVRIPTDKEGRKSNFAFVTMRHEISVEYAIELLNGTKLFDRRLTIKPRVPSSARQQQQQQLPQQMPVFQFDNNYPQHVFDNMSHQNMMANVQNVFQMGALLEQSYNYSHNANNHQQFHGNNHRKRSPYERNDNYQRNNSGYNRHDNYGDNSRRRQRNHSFDRNNRNRYH